MLLWLWVGLMYLSTSIYLDIPKISEILCKGWSNFKQKTNPNLYRQKNWTDIFIFKYIYIYTVFIDIYIYTCSCISSLKITHIYSNFSLKQTIPHYQNPNEKKKPNKKNKTKTPWADFASFPRTDQMVAATKVIAPKTMAPRKNRELLTVPLSTDPTSRSTSNSSCF